MTLWADPAKILPADPAEIRAVADRIAAHAGAARTRAHRLGCSLAAADWCGPAARVFALAADDAIHSMRLAAARLDDAATELRRHADTVEQVHDAIRGLGHDAGRVVGELRQGLVDEVTVPTRLLCNSTRLAADTRDLLGGAGELIGIGSG